MLGLYKNVIGLLYIIYKQDFEYKYNYDNIKMIILNNIYNDEEITIKDNEYVNKTLMSKFDYNKQFENNNKKNLDVEK